MQEEKEIVILPHFNPEEVAALKVEHERQQQIFHGHAELDNDHERIREAMQRKTALEANQETDGDSYAEVLYELGEITEAIEIVKDPIKKEHWQRRLDAILKDDNEFCNCPETVPGVNGEGQAIQHSTTQVIRKYPSIKHGGKLTPVVVCTLCNDVNVTNAG